MKVNAIYKISDHPLIWTSHGSKNWKNLRNNTKKEAFLLAHTMWHFSWSSLIMYYKQKKILKSNNIKLILLHNSNSEYRFSKFFGFESRLINHNIHSCEHIFNIDKNTDKLYDAVYIAAAKPYKRLHLARKIKKLFVVTYFWPDVTNENGEWDLHAFEPQIKHAKFNKFRIDSTSVNAIVNKSKCSLALSKKEGAMFAVIESLLAGVPVVTTKSKGGRDFFLSSENSLIVEANADDVANGVYEIINKNLSPERVRNTTLKNVKQNRNVFLDVIIQIIGDDNINKREELYYQIWGNPKGISNLIVHLQ